MRHSLTTTDHLPQAEFVDALDAETLRRLRRLVGDARSWAGKILGQEPPVRPCFMHEGALHALITRKGKGGFAEAWTTRTENREREVIGKFLHGRSRDARFHSSAERMRGEGRILEALDVPGVPEALGSGELDDSPYLLMESIDGISWREMLRREQIPLPFILRSAHEAACTMAAVHARGIVHSDLKPENMMFGRGETGSWRTWIIDFGLAVETGSASTRVTSEGQTVGTHGFLDPRHVGHALKRDASGDVYALGATFYEWYARKPLFAEDEWLRVLTQDAECFDAHVERAMSALPGTHRRFEALLKDMLLYELPGRPRPSARTVADRLRAMACPVRTNDAPSLEDAITILSRERAVTRRAVFGLLSLTACGALGWMASQTEDKTKPDPSPVKPFESPAPAIKLKAMRDEVRLELHGALAWNLRRRDATVFGRERDADLELWMADMTPETLCSILERLKAGSSAGLPKRTYSCYISRAKDSTMLVTPRGVLCDDAFVETKNLETDTASGAREHLRRWPTDGKLIDVVRSAPEETDAKALLAKANEYLRQLQQKAAVRAKVSRGKKEP